jgi:hypothetical protein
VHGALVSGQLNGSPPDAPLAPLAATDKGGHKPAEGNKDTRRSLVSKRHQSSRRKAYGRRQRELRQRPDHDVPGESIDLSPGSPGDDEAGFFFGHLGGQAALRDRRDARLHFASAD